MPTQATAVNVQDCHRCRLADRLQGEKIVPGYGNTDCQIMLVNEAPGKTEAFLGKPFVGDAGSTLNSLLKQADINRDDLYLSNVCKCRPWAWKENPVDKTKYLVTVTPDPKDIRTCIQYLYAEIDAIKPKVIITLGGAATSALVGKVVKITEKMGVPSLYSKSGSGSASMYQSQHRTYIVPTLHPSFLDRNGGMFDRQGSLTVMAQQVIENLKMAKDIASNSILFQEHRYLIVDNREKLNKVIQIARDRKVLAFDIETEGLSFWDRILGVGFSVEVGTACYIPFLANDMFVDGLQEFWTGKDISRDEVIAELKNLFEDPTIHKSAHGAKFDMRGLKREFGIEVKNLAWDSMCSAYLINENTSHKLKDMKNRYIDLLGYEDIYYKETDNGNRPKNASLDVIANYNCGDTDATYRITKEHRTQFSDNAANMGLMDNLYVPLMEFITDFEYDGVAYDRDRAIAMASDYTKKAQVLKEDIWRHAGCRDWNPDSKDDLVKILFTVLNLKHKNKTTTGLQSSDTKVLEDLAKEHIVPKLIIEYRHFNKMRSTYMERFIKESEKDGRLHLSTNPIGTITGRMSSEGLQNIPKEIAIKSLFIAPPGYKLVQGDLSQAEVRCFTHYADEPSLREAFAAGTIDVHCMVAAEVNNIPYKEFHDKYKAGDIKISEMRQAAKGCVHKDTRVITNQGLIQIKELGDITQPGFCNLKSHISVVGLDGRMTPADKFFNNGIEKCYKIITENGYEFCGTQDHKMQVLCPDGKIQDKRFENITKEDYVVVRLKYPELLETVTGSDSDILEKIDVTNFRGNSYVFSPPKKLTHKWGWFLGFLIGEGCFYTDRVCWSQKDSDEAMLSAKIAEELTGIPVKYAQHNRKTKNGLSPIWDMMINSVQFRDFLRQLGITDGYYDKKKRQRGCCKLVIPEIIFKSSYLCMQGFLQGMWDADGTVTKTKKGGQMCVKMGLASEALIKDMQTLMIYFGVIVKRYKEYNKKYNRDYYYMIIVGREAKENFYNNIGFLINKNRSSRLKEIIQDKDSLNSSIEIPYQNSLMRTLYNTLPPTCRKTNQRWKDTIQVRLKRNINLRSHVLNSIPYEYTKSVPIEFRGDFYFDKVETKNEDSLAETYDLSVPNGNHYAVNGCSLHNTVFGLCYGRGPRSIAEEYKIPYEDAVLFTTKFFGHFPNFKKWIDDTIKQAHTTGQVTNIYGRIRRLPAIFSSEPDQVAGAERQAVNSVIQSTASDMTCLSLCKIHKHFKNNNTPARIVLTVHDSIVVEARDDYVPYVIQLLKNIMEEKPHPDFSVKIRADIDTMQRWGVKLEKNKI